MNNPFATWGGIVGVIAGFIYLGYLVVQDIKSRKGVDKKEEFASGLNLPTKKPSVETAPVQEVK